MPIVLEGITHTYLAGTPMAVTAIEDINLTIADGTFLGLIGATGSGKSTLVQHLNGLLRPTRGRVIVDGQVIGDKGTDLREIRRRVGLVFQYPEYQLFEETVLADVSYGPRNLGLSPEAARQRARKALRLVGLSANFEERSPFALSGGQMRRVALAGVLAMEPRVLILDEPAAGLDPRGRDEILAYVAKLHRELGITVILVSHNMEDIARYADRVVVMSRGQIWRQGTPREIFALGRELADLGLGVPPVSQLAIRLAEQGWNIRRDVLTVDEAEEEIIGQLRRNGRVR